MSMLEPLYVAARRVLLNALEALGEHRNAVVLVGAQAIYLQAGDADLEASVAPYTTDADLGIDPMRLGSNPRIVEAMTKADFELKVKAGNGGVEPGTWETETEVNGKPTRIPVDLLVPEQLAPQPRGRRDARLPEHGKNATRWTPGIEATMFDISEMSIVSLEPERDPREMRIRVAGPSSLLIAKSHKIGDRLIDRAQGRGHRVKPKDCADVIRLMRAPTPPAAVGVRLAEIAKHPSCATSVSDGVQKLVEQFGRPRSVGVDLAIDSLGGALPEEEIRALAPGYIDELLAAYRRR